MLIQLIMIFTYQRGCFNADRQPCATCPRQISHFTWKKKSKERERGKQQVVLVLLDCLAIREGTQKKKSRKGRKIKNQAILYPSVITSYPFGSACKVSCLLGLKYVSKQVPSLQQPHLRESEWWDPSDLRRTMWDWWKPKSCQTAPLFQMLLSIH